VVPPKHGVVQLSTWLRAAAGCGLRSRLGRAATLSKANAANACAAARIDLPCASFGLGWSALHCRKRKGVGPLASIGVPCGICKPVSYTARRVSSVAAVSSL